MFNSEKYATKWKKIIEHADLPEIKDPYRKAITTIALENQQKALREEASQQNFLTEQPAGTTQTSSVSNWDPVLIGLVRRTMPNLLAYDILGVQPMNGPTGLVFCMKSRYAAGTRPVSTSSTEALFNEADTDYSGTGTHAGDSSSLPINTSNPLGGVTGDSNSDGVADDFGVGDPFATAAGEILNTDATGAGSIAEMGFTIERAAVTAKTRALKAGYTMEMAQDLKAIHGLDAETELANILSTELLAEINRELVRKVNVKAKLGCQHSGLTRAGTFDLQTDADGRWSVERYKGMLVQLEREANVIAKETRRGKGNFILCSSDVAAALAASGVLDYAPALSTNLQVDDTGNTFAGVLNGRIKVFIDPYATVDYVNVGYRGPNPYDAGLFYCPYVPLTMVKAIGEEDFQPRIGFKTRYGLVANPFVGSTPSSNEGTNRANPYYRIFRVQNILA